jgi:hypothetical protein
MGRIIGLLVSAGLTAACGVWGDDGGKPIELSVTEVLGEEPHAVEVRGVERATLRRLSSLAPNESSWRRFVVVYVEQASRDTSSPEDATSAPPVIGRYVLSGDRLRFEPRFPFAEGVSYRVEVDTAALARATSGATAGTARTEPLVHRFAIPSIDRARTTRIVAVHPSTPRLPANLLRWYVETSAPMEAGSALANIRLLDESGREVRGAFLALDQELWDTTRRRLTLLLDPGRVKRGVRTNLESGAPLVAGRRYRLVIDDAWKDGTGAALASGFEMAFEAVEDDRRSPDPARWHLTPPPVGTRSPLQVAFGESLDRALAARLIEVLDARGALVPGSVELSGQDSVWNLTPHAAWAEGDYTLRVGGALEDLAGNNVARVFDVDRRTDSAAIDRGVSGSTRSVRFRIL